MLYPLIPWIGVMPLGYALGPVFKMEPARRARMLYSLGIALTLAFILCAGWTCTATYGIACITVPRC